MKNIERVGGTDWKKPKGKIFELKWGKKLAKADWKFKNETAQKIRCKNLSN
jgi:hypothetical protein